MDAALSYYLDPLHSTQPVDQDWDKLFPELGKKPWFGSAPLSRPPLVLTKEVADTLKKTVLANWYARNNTYFRIFIEVAIFSTAASLVFKAAPPQAVGFLAHFKNRVVVAAGLLATIIPFDNWIIGRYQQNTKEAYDAQKEALSALSAKYVELNNKAINAHLARDKNQKTYQDAQMKELQKAGFDREQATQILAPLYP